MLSREDKAMQEASSYRVVRENGSARIEEKKSRFIADVFAVTTQQEAEEQINLITKRYWDARHHCYAYVLGSQSEIARCSDNGEPSGTAGKPILEVITGEHLTNTLIVVTRYFGGILLGTGGLVRAYTQAAQAGISAAEKGWMAYGEKLTVQVEYNQVNAIQYYFKQEKITVKEQRYAEKVEYDIIVIMAQVGDVKEKIARLTDGRAKTLEKEAGYYEMDERFIQLI